MNGVLLPDEVLATMGLLRGTATRLVSQQIWLDALHALCAPQFIDTFLRPAWADEGRGVLHNCIVVQGAGGFGKERDLPLTRGRVEVKCYSAQKHIARQMGAIVGNLLMPPDRSIASWLAANTLVTEAQDVTNPVLLKEPDTGYDFTFQSANLRFVEIAVTA